MNFKVLLKSKASWTGVVSVGAGVFLCLRGHMDTGLQLISTGLAAIFLRDAIAKPKEQPDKK